MEFGVCASPRISFSRDFVEVDADAATGSLEDAAGKRFYSSDFEFAMAACFDPPQGCAPGAAMLPADELISHGILLPFEHSRCSGRHSVSASTSRQLPYPHASSSVSVSASAPSLTASRSYPSSRREVSPPLSPKAPKCGAKWREFLGLRAKSYDVGAGKEAAKASSASSSSKIMKLFYRSRSVGSGEVDRLTIPARPSLSSIPQSSSHTFLQEQISVDSSSPENGGCWTDPEGYTGSSARLWMRPGSASKIKGECTSPGGNFPSNNKPGSPGRRNAVKSSSCVRDGEQAANGRIGMRNRERDKSSSSSKIHEHARNDRWGEQWRLADNTIAYSKVRVAPVLLNVPACMAPSLRGVKVSKTKLMNPRHLLPPKKPQHSKPL